MYQKPVRFISPQFVSSRKYLQVPVSSTSHRRRCRQPASRRRQRWRGPGRRVGAPVTGRDGWTVAFAVVIPPSSSHAHLRHLYPSPLTAPFARPYQTHALSCAPTDMTTSGRGRPMHRPPPAATLWFLPTPLAGRILGSSSVYCTSLQGLQAWNEKPSWALHRPILVKRV